MSTAHVRLRPPYAVKRIMRHGLGLFEREIMALRLLEEFPWAPSLVNSYAKTETILMEYAGNEITKSTLPDDWEEQMIEILNGLKAAEVRHNDIKPGEILVREGRLSLVDYGWASIPGSTPNFPSGLGGKFKHPKRFDDDYSFRLSVQSVLDS